MLGFINEYTLQAYVYGPRVALNNMLISFTKWFIGAKRITITYKKK